MSQNEKKEIAERDLSIVEIAAILVMRKNWFFLSFFLFLVVSLIFLSVRENQNQYMSIYQMPIKGGNEFLVSPATVVTNLETTLLSQVETILDKEGATQLSEIEILDPEDSFIIRIQSRATPHEQARVEKQHQLLLQELNKWLSNIYRETQERIKKRLVELNQVRENLQNQKDSGQAIAGIIERKIEMESELDSMKPGVILTVAQIDTEEVGASSKLLLLLSAIFSIFFAAIFSFFVEFITRVRAEVARLKSGKNQ